MASYDGSIVIKTEVDQTGIKTGVAGISSSLKKLAGTVAVAFGVRAIVNMGKAAINLASDLQEVQNVVDVSFGAMSYKIEEFSKTAIEQFGISELSAKTMASTFMAMGQGMGQGLEIGSDKAIELTARLADVMSFYNKSMSEVNTIGRAVYSGETESLKQIGIIMTQTNLEAFALAQGYGQLYKNMDAANQLLVRQEFFLNATELAMGDFANTQDSWANSTRVLSERWNEFLTIIGSRLIQALTPVVNFLNTVLSAAINVATAISNILGFEAKVSTASSSVGGLASAESDLASSTEDANSALSDQLAAFDDINVLNSQSGSGTNVLSSFGGGGTSIDYGETSVLGDKASELEEKLRPLVESIQHLGEALGRFISLAWKGFIDFFKELFGIEDWDSTDLAGWIDDFATSIDNLDDDTIEDIGTALGVLATSIIVFKVGGVAANALSFLTSNLVLLKSLGTIAVVVAVAVKGFELGKELGKLINPEDTEVYEDFTWFGEGGFFPSITDDFGLSLDALATMATDFVNNPVIATLTTAILGPFATSLLALIKYKDDIKDLVLDKLTDAFGDFIENYKAFGGTLNDETVSMWDIIKFNMTMGFAKGINDVLTMLNNMLSSIVSILNSWGGINFKVPDWIPEIGGMEANIGFGNLTAPQIPLIRLPQKKSSTGSKAGMPTNIPGLATGAVIPPNSKFLAMLGDQTSGTNIEAPLDTIVEAMNISLGNRGGGNQEIILKINETEIGRVMTPLVMSEQNRLGYDVVMTGV